MVCRVSPCPVYVSHGTCAQRVLLDNTGLLSMAAQARASSSLVGDRAIGPETPCVHIYAMGAAGPVSFGVVWGDEPTATPRRQGRSRDEAPRGREAGGAGSSTSSIVLGQQYS